MSTRVLPALIRSPIQDGTPPTIRRVSATNSNRSHIPVADIELGDHTEGRLLLVGLMNRDNWPVYASKLEILNGPIFQEDARARADTVIGGQGWDFATQLFWIEETSLTGLQTFRITYSQNVEITTLIVYEIGGADNSAPIGEVVTDDTGPDLTTQITTTQDNSLLIYGAGGEDYPSTPVSGFTEDIDLNVQGQRLATSGHRVARNTGTYSAGAVFSGSGSGAGGTLWVAEIKKAAP